MKIVRYNKITNQRRKKKKWTTKTHVENSIIIHRWRLIRVCVMCLTVRNVALHAINDSHQNSWHHQQHAIALLLQLKKNKNKITIFSRFSRYCATWIECKLEEMQTQISIKTKNNMMLQYGCFHCIRQLDKWNSVQMYKPINHLICFAFAQL